MLTTSKLLVGGHDDDPGAAPIEPKRRSKRLVARADPLFMDMVAQASYLKTKKLGEAPPPPLTVDQIQVLGQGCKLEKKKLETLEKACNKVPRSKK